MEYTLKWMEINIPFVVLKEAYSSGKGKKAAVKTY